jgi:hypothetical protein
MGTPVIPAGVEPAIESISDQELVPRQMIEGWHLAWPLRTYRELLSGPTGSAISFRNPVWMTGST